MDDFYEGNGGDGRKDSVYSYSYRSGSRNQTVHEGDYYSASGGGGDKKKSGFGTRLIRCVLLAAVFGLVAAGVFVGITRIAGSTETKTEEQGMPATVENTEVYGGSVTDQAVVVSDVSDMVENVMPSIVAITSMTQTEYYNWFGQSQLYDSESSGSGIVVADDEEYLYIATNNHVISGSRSLTVCFADNSTVAAQVKGADENSDLAVLSVKKDDLESTTLNQIRVATVGDSDELKVGQSVIAIGNALGYGQSVTTGVISALNREVTATNYETGETTTSELIQTDAAINPGNSGGALLNIRGEVIGINSIKYSDTQVEGMGYAIPISRAKPIIDELIMREVVDESRSAFIGIVGVDVTRDVASAYQMPEGVYIARVYSGSAADQAGILEGDIITAFDGKEVRAMESLNDLLRYYEAGTEVDVTIRRADNGEYVEQTIPVRLGSKN